MQINASQTVGAASKAAIAAALLMSSGIVRASEWVYVGLTRQDDIWLADFESLDVGKSMWVRTDWEKPRPSVQGKPKMVNSTKIRYAVNCRAGTLGIAQAIEYSERFGLGETVSSTSQDPLHETPPPDSIGERLLRFACSKQFRDQLVAEYRATVQEHRTQKQSGAPQ